MSTAAFEVLATGPSLLVEDLGRPGYAHLGVPPSGALDPDALALANRLVGNPEGAPGLEVLLGGVRMRALASGRIALTGAEIALTVGGRAQPWGEAVSVRAGHEVRLGSADTGLRAWLAMSGGLAGHGALGSSSTDTLTGLGPPPVSVGDVLSVGDQVGDPASGSAVPPAHEPEVVRLGIRLGPRDDWFTSDALSRLTVQTYVISEDSNRVALRLTADGSPPLVRSRQGELPSEGLVTGAVQVPANGEPVVFLADHPVTGGYPVIAVVDRRDLRRCAQLRPGDRLTFSLLGRPAPAAPPAED